MRKMKIIECPRDAMQGFDHFIPTEVKIDYLNLLLKVGFDTLDFGSFVSPKAIPQMADTHLVLEGLNLVDTDTKLLAIVANLRGAKDATIYPQIDYLGYPFSISEQFQQRNTKRSIEDSMILVDEMQELCVRANKQLVIYISMAFGNPYGDPWDVEIAEKWVDKMYQAGIRVISLSDTVGVASVSQIEALIGTLPKAYPEVEFGAHFHSRPDNWFPKLEAAWHSGCRRFDTAIKGFGGCPMADDTLTGNMATENLLTFLKHVKQPSQLDDKAFQKAFEKAGSVFI